MTRFFGPGNKMMIFGTGKNVGGNLVMTDVTRRRLDRGAEVYCDGNFNRRGEEPSILLSGGYGVGEFPDGPPPQREAHLMAEYIIEQYNIPRHALLIEDESTNTDENFINSLAAYPKFFETIGERRLGLVSQEFHAERIITAGAAALAIDEVLQESGRWYRYFVAATPPKNPEEKQVTTDANIVQLTREAMYLAADS